MEINNKTKEDIIFFLDNQKQMYNLAINDRGGNIMQRKGINMLLKKLDKLLKTLNEQ